MKIRKGFVSNSSSSSFLLDNSGGEVSEMILFVNKYFRFNLFEGLYYGKRALLKYLGDIADDLDTDYFEYHDPELNSVAFEGEPLVQLVSEYLEKNKVEDLVLVELSTHSNLTIPQEIIIAKRG